MRNLAVKENLESQELIGLGISELNNMNCDTVQLQDCIEAMSLMRPSSVDIIIADPPYNLSKGGKWSWDNTANLPGFGGKWKVGYD